MLRSALSLLRTPFSIHRSLPNASTSTLNISAQCSLADKKISETSSSQKQDRSVVKIEEPYANKRMYTTSSVLHSLQFRPAEQKVFNNLAVRSYHSHHLYRFVQLGQEYPWVGIIEAIDVNRLESRRGSGVYLGSGVVVTAAHVVENMSGSNAYFSLDCSTYIRARQCIIHPEYKNFSKSDKHDIAFILLANRPIVPLPELQFELSMPNPDCIAAGFPNRFVARNSDDRQTNAPLLNPPARIATFASCFPSAIHGCLEHQIGYRYGKPVKFNVLESGIFPGMSGGGLFLEKDKKLAGIIVSSTESASFSRTKGAHDFFKRIDYPFVEMLSEAKLIQQQKGI